ncbi:MAG: isocitrate lyase/phosphoenolpyruvate mutase family protein, partial [Nitrosopumilus sp.]
MKFEKIKKKGCLKVLEAHNGLSAKLVEESEFDGIWVSSLTHSASKGLPDIELIPLSERVDLVREIRRVSTKPIYVDVDTGGGHFGYHAKWFKDAGA